MAGYTYLYAVVNGCKQLDCKQLYYHMESDVRHCIECDKPLKGRVDKKFCDDYCRNAYNNRRNSDQNNFVRNINNTLRRNRRVLESVIPNDADMGKCPKAKLQQQGFDFTYHTHQYANRKGTIYYFCYEFGYLPLEGDWVLIVKRNKVE
jgi:predicted nucleic acid-binding Zn ribbon protein